MKDYRQEETATPPSEGEQIIALLERIARHLRTIKIVAIVITIMPIILWIGWQVLMAYVTSAP